MDNTDQPNSICHVRPIQMYPLQPPETKINLPFNLLAGESVAHSGNSVDGLLVLTSYRLFVQLCESQYHIPLGLIESVEQRELFHLQIGCKDARTYRCTFDNNEVCLDWYNQLLKASAPPRQLEELFAFCNYVWSKEQGGEEVLSKIKGQKGLFYDDVVFAKEVTRMNFDCHGAWRISAINKAYKLCPSYPPLLLVPSCISDENLEIVAKFRSSQRIPAVVWRHSGNGAVIARCSQPEVGWLGWRSAEDEDLIKAISDACTFDRGPKTMLDKESNNSHSPASVHSEDFGHAQPMIDMQEKKKVLIMDARSYTTAVANRARGGGCECPEYYPSCEIQFMNLANIHSIRKSFHALRLLCTAPADQPNWHSQLENTRWLQHMSGVMRAAVALVTAVERDARPVLVHCSDGWDRTPQIVALAELLLDPFYRTIDGFRILIEREWLAFGHKFADRCGHATGSGDQNERCPVFLQWLDCVHQVLCQFPCFFEFSPTYLVKLAQHTYSNLFGTFLCNTKQERVERVNDNTFSVWGFLNSACFRNHVYLDSPQVLWPQCNVRDLQLWSEVYLGSLEMRSTGEGGCNACPGPPDSVMQHMTKTRSYGDLPNAADVYSNQIRRCSDPNITVDSLKISTLNISDDSQSDENSQENISKQTTIVNGHTTPTNGDFLGSDSEDIDCKSDCIYKNTTPAQNAADDLPDGGRPTPGRDGSDDGFAQREAAVFAAEGVNSGADNLNVIELEKTESVGEEDAFGCGRDVTSGLREASNFESICLRSRSDDAPACKGDINHNGDVRQDDFDSDTECTEPSESKSENTVCDMVRNLSVLKSVETSTETLVSENLCGSLPKDDVDRFEKLASPDTYNGNNDFCKICAQNLTFIHDKYSHHPSGNTSGKTSRYSTPPLYSRTPSANGWDNSLLSMDQHKNLYTYQCTLGDDGLVPLRSDVQDRIRQIITDYKIRQEALQRDLQALQKELVINRQALTKQLCQKCSHNETDRNDDTLDSDACSVRSQASESPKSVSHCFTPIRASPPVHTMSSVVDSVCSAGEGQASAVESLRSDMSWEAIEEGAALPELTATLWVPDHAVSKCTGCQKEFWIGKRKHHCRNCGRIFCADCSENSTPLPSEHLYNPVRVCTSCYCKLRRDCGEIPDQCKHVASQATNNNPQIAASSN